MKLISIGFIDGFIQRFGFFISSYFPFWIFLLYVGQGKINQQGQYGNDKNNQQGMLQKTNKSLFRKEWFLFFILNSNSFSKSAAPRREAVFMVFGHIKAINYFLTDLIFDAQFLFRYDPFLCSAKRKYSSADLHFLHRKYSVKHGWKYEQNYVVYPQ